MKLYRIFLPKKYKPTDEKNIPMKYISDFAEKIEERFSGYSMDPFASLPVIDGSWTDDKSGLKYKEPMFLFEIFVEDTFDNISWIKAEQELIRQKLKQDIIFIISLNAELIR